VTSVAVVAHAGKSFGGGLSELRATLAHAGVTHPIWIEVPKSRKAPKAMRKAVEAGADLVLVWGGDGMVQRCVDALGNSGVVLAIIPAGTANLLASNLGIPRDIEAAVDVALHGERHQLDVGRFNDERFAVMAGAGWDALMIRDADNGLKRRFGRLAYVWTGLRHLRESRFEAVVKVDGHRWFRGKASSILVGNVAKVFGPVAVFHEAEPDDGLLEVAVITASGWWQWACAFVSVVIGRPERSSFGSATRAHTIRVKLDRPVHYELDGGERGTTQRVRVDVEPAALVIAVPTQPS
jgi:diacylglycerol kinase family enzyme